MLLNYFKTAIPTIRKHLIVSYLILWGISTTVMYLAIRVVYMELIAGLVWRMVKIVDNTQIAYFLAGCLISAPIIAFRYKKQPFCSKDAVTPFIVVAVSISSIFQSIFTILTKLTFPDYNYLTEELTRGYSSFNISFVLGAAITGSIMLYVILSDRPKEKTTQLL